jgi:Secretion system C-terminal sorting domain
MKQLYKIPQVVACLFFFATVCNAQVTLNADGPGNTYELINSVLAPGYNAVEAPDLIHAGFGRHIAEVFDVGLNKNVFEFYSHLTPDNEPNNPLLTDRQRVEIKTYDQSPANLIGTSGETVTYKWRFKIPVGFQPSPNFTHLHQIKAVGGDDGDPIFTLTARLGTPNKLELIYVPDMSASQDKKQTVNLSSFEGVWVEVTEKVLIGASGSYSISIKRVTDNAILMAYTNTNIATIRPDNTFIRPKWGIYRSILSPGDLRDEAVRFSDFSITEGFTTFGPQTYFWNGNLGPTLFTTPSNWNTALDGSGVSRPAIPPTDDILIMDGSNVAGNIFPSVTGTVTGQMTGNTISQLKLQNNMQLVLQRIGGTTGTLVVAGDATTDPDFSVPAGCSITINSLLADGNVNINLTNPATGLVSGTITLSNTGTHRITSQTQNGLVFTSGATFNSAGIPASAAYPFGSSTQGLQNGVVFQAGSNLVVTGNRSPFAGTSTFQSCLMMSGSNTYFKSTNAISGFGSWSNLKTLGNVFVQNNSTFSSDGPFYKIDSLTIDAGSTFITHSSGSTPVFGNLVVNGTLSAPALSTNVLVMGGNVAQTLSGSGSITVPNLVVANASDVTLSKSVSVGTATNIFGKINLGGTSQITGAGTFSTRTQSTATSVVGNLVIDSFVVRGVPASPVLSGVNGLKVSGTGIAPNTNVVGFSASAGTINLSKPATANGTAITLTFSSDSATIATSNVNGLDSLTGGVIVTGNKSYASGTSYVINGATTKPIGVSSGNTTNMQVGDLTINAATTLNYNIRVRGILALNAGNLTLRPLDTLRITSGNDIAGAPFSASKYIVSGRAGNDLGILRMDNFTTAKTFPIGTAANYLPVTLTPTAAMSYAVSVFEGATVDGTPAGTLVSAGIKDESVDAVWTINRTLGSGDCAMQLNWTTGLEGTLFSPLSNINMGISRYSAGAYESATGTGDNAANSATSTFINFSPFMVTKKAGVLPVDFKSITATVKQNYTEVKWNVESEFDIQSYVVEKSMDGRVFAPIGTVIATNNRSYTFNDASPLLNNIFYYRIKIVSLAGDIKYSSIVFVKQNNGIDVVVYPNPVNDVLSIAGLKSNATIKIINAAGQIILQQNTTASSLSIDAKSIKPGIYVMQVFSNGNKQSSQTIIKQ